MKVNNIMCKNTVVSITHIKKTTTINYSHNDNNFITQKKIKVYYTYLILKQFYRNTITNLNSIYLCFFIENALRVHTTH